MPEITCPNCGIAITIETPRLCVRCGAELPAGVGKLFGGAFVMCDTCADEVITSWKIAASKDGAK